MLAFFVASLSTLVLVWGVCEAVMSAGFVGRDDGDINLFGGCRGDPARSE